MGHLQQASSLHWDHWERWGWELRRVRGCWGLLQNTAFWAFCGHTYKTYKNSNMDWGGAHEAPLLAEELLAVAGCQGRSVSFLLGHSWVVAQNTANGLISTTHTYSTNWTWWLKEDIHEVGRKSSRGGYGNSWRRGDEREFNQSI